MGFETPEEGYLAKIIVPAGTKNIGIGSLVCIIVPDASSVTAFKDFKDDGSAAPAPKAAAAAAAPPPPPAPKAAPQAAPKAAAPPPSIPTAAGDRVYASPMAKRLAAERGISLQVFIFTLKLFDTLIHLQLNQFYPGLKRFGLIWIDNVKRFRRRSFNGWHCFRRWC